MRPKVNAENLDMARLEAIEVVRRMVRAMDSSDLEGAPAAEAAEEIVDELFLNRADLVQRLVYPPASRFWVSRSYWTTLPRVFRGGDEFGNRTVCLRLGPLSFVLALNVPLRRVVERMDIEPGSGA